jgi:hypothetical protein
VQENTSCVPEIAGGSFSSPTIGVATPLAGALAHARVIILQPRTACLCVLSCAFALKWACRCPSSSKTTFRAVKKGLRVAIVALKPHFSEKRVHDKRCDSCEANEFLCLARTD